MTSCARSASRSRPSTEPHDADTDCKHSCLGRRALLRRSACARPPRSAKPAKPKDPLEPARAALRTLQFNKAIELLGAAGSAGNADAQYLLGLMYLNGVGVVADTARARARCCNRPPSTVRARPPMCWPASSRAIPTRRPAPPTSGWSVRPSWDMCAPIEALKSGRPLLDRESVGASDPALLAAWVIDCARKNDAAELRRLGPASAAVRDEFGRGALSYAAEAGSVLPPPQRCWNWVPTCAPWTRRVPPR